MGYRIITDATSDITKEMFEGLEMPLVIPMEVTIDGKTKLFGIDQELKMDDFFIAQRADKEVKTTQINPYSYEEFFSKVLEEGDDILYLCFSTGMSASYNNAVQAQEAAQAKYPERQIIVIDSLCGSVGEALLVMQCSKMKQEGASIEKVASFATEHRLEVIHWFTVDDLRYLRKGGRISGTAAVVGTILNIKPILNVDHEGRLASKMKMFGTKMALKYLVKKYEEEADPSSPLFIGHTDALPNAQYVETEIKKKHPDLKTYISMVGPIIAAHTGPGLTVIAYWGKKRV